MRKLLVFVLVFVLAVPSAFANGPRFNAIRPLQVLSEDGKTYRNICTTYKLNDVWMTDAHCVIQDGKVAEVQFYIAGKKASIDRVDGLNDLATLRGGPAVVGYKLSLRAPDYLEPAYTAGYPFGWGFMLTTAGEYSGQGAFPDDDSKIPYAFYHVAGAGGDSGSPVFNKEGLVVGQIQITLCMGAWQGFCPILGSATHENLVKFVGQ